MWRHGWGVFRGSVSGAAASTAGCVVVLGGWRWDRLPCFCCSITITPATTPCHLPNSGTRRGITAAQLDVKLPGGVPLEILEEAVAAAARGRYRLLDAMESALPAQRSPTSPAFGSVRVPSAMLGRVIGSGGSTLREMEEQHNARIDIEDSGEWGAELRCCAAMTLVAFRSCGSRVVGWPCSLPSHPHPVPPLPQPLFLPRQAWSTSLRRLRRSTRQQLTECWAWRGRTSR